MVVLSKKVGVLAGLIATAATSLALATSASADTAGRSGDVVMVGSDTAQNAVNFLLDTAPGVLGGYNNLNNNNRALAWDATGDANGRLPYDGTCGTPDPATTGLGAFCDATTNKTPNSQPQSAILRVGTKPVTRPNGSGAGVAALIADAKSPGYQGLTAGSIQVARMSRLPNSTEEGNCPTSDTACGGLHVYQLATDHLDIAARSSSFGGTNAPAGLSAQQLVAIYQCTATKWTDVGGSSTSTIHPLIPQSGSGTRNFFLADLQVANGGTAISLGGCVRTVQEHDPTGIWADPSPSDAIEPFSTGKIALINSGYFANAGYATTAGKNAYSAGFLNALSGAPSDANVVYDSVRGMYVVIRNVDLGSSTPFQPGGTQNWAQTLLAGGTSYFARSAQGAEIRAAGFTQAYKDCGINPTTC
jgi:ABC-type phosphate transport system substrate-binding protein